MTTVADKKKILDPKRVRQGDSREKFVHAIKVAGAKGNDQEISTLAGQYVRGEIMLTDWSVMATKNASDRATVDMILNTDDREIGINNIAKGQLAKGQYLLVSSITVLGFCVPVTADAASVLTRGSQEEKDAFKKSAFQSINGNTEAQKNLAIVANGELRVRVRNKDVMSGLALHRFQQDNNGQTDIGTLELTTPFLIRSQEPIEVILDLPTAAKPNTLVRVLLNGTATVPA